MSPVFSPERCSSRSRYSTPTLWTARARSVRATISSFAAVRDRAVLDVQPLRLEITTLREPMSLSSFVQRYPQPVSIEELARLNRVGPDEIISAGTRIKTVVGSTVG